MTTYDIIRELASGNVATSFNFKTFKSYDLIQDRMRVTSQLKKVFDSALKKRDSYQLPFWDSFNLSLFNSDHDNYDFIKEISFHNPAVSNIKVDSRDVMGFLNKVDRDFDYLTINSTIKDKNGVSKQLILLDFHIPVNLKNQKICKAIIKHLALDGYLLDSGKSFHFFGITPVTRAKLNNVLNKALLYAPIIDRAWITHQLIERSCCLRISKKYDRIPFVVEKI